MPYGEQGAVQQHIGMDLSPAWVLMRQAHVFLARQQQGWELDAHQNLTQVMPGLATVRDRQVEVKSRLGTSIAAARRGCRGKIRDYF